MKLSNIVSNDSGMWERSGYLIAGTITVVALIMLLGINFSLDTVVSKALVFQEPAMLPASSLHKTVVKSVRLDLSSITPPANDEAFIEEVLNRVIEAGGNAVFLSPWADGYANYASTLAPKNKFGKRRFTERFLRKAKAVDIKTYAWFVVGKDDFPALLHPEWFSKTIRNKRYYHNDQPGVSIPVASLAHEGYLHYHRLLVEEAARLGFDGWVISEPLASWGDRSDPDYADFSSSVKTKFKRQYGVDPRLLFSATSRYYFEKNPSLYQKWVNFRAATVTRYVNQSLQAIRSRSGKPIVITLFTEPDRRGKLVPLKTLKEWLGMDVQALASLKPNYFEIQDLFLDFEFPQSPTWTTSMIRQFKQQIHNRIPLMVSVQGFDSENKKLDPQDFGTAMSLALEENVAGVSFYAYHTVQPEHWEALKKVWR